MKRWQDIGEVPDSDEEGEGSFTSTPERKSLEQTGAQDETVDPLQPAPGHIVTDAIEASRLVKNASAWDTLQSFGGADSTLCSLDRERVLEAAHNTSHANRKVSTPSEAASSPLSECGVTPEAPRFFFPRIEDWFTGQVDANSPSLTARESTSSFEGRAKPFAAKNGSNERPDFHSLDANSEFDGPSSDLALPGQELPSFATDRSVALNADEEGDHAVAQALHQAVARRNFRARKEIQLHPFMIENARHNLEFTRVGLRPVRLDDASQRRGRAHRPPSEDEAGSSQQSFQSRTSSPKLGHEEQCSYDAQAERNSNKTASSTSVFDFPDKNALQTRKIRDGLQLGAKRTKTSHSTQRPRIQSQIGQSNRVSRTPPAEDEFSIPPSPPLTSSDTPQPRVLPSGFRLPAIHMVATPTALPTPQVSSAVRAPDRDSLHNHHDGLPVLRTASRSRNSLRRPARARVVESSSETLDANSSADSEIDERRLQKERRRIRGVLPASWLKLDAQAQKTRAPPPQASGHRRSPSPPSLVGPQKGVAQVVSRRRHMTTIDSLVISDNSNDEGDSSAEHHKRGAMAPQQGSLQLEPGSPKSVPVTLADEDDMELDWVDPMLLPHSHRTSMPIEKKQPKVKGVVARATSKSKDRVKRHLFQDPSRHSFHRHGAKQYQRKSNQRQRAFQLSVLDAPSPASDQPHSTPQFLRVAKRTAKQREDLGRCSPRGKILRLATEADSNDALATLHSWREGAIAPREIHREAFKVTNIAEKVGSRESASSLGIILPGPKQHLLPSLERIAQGAASNELTPTQPDRTDPRQPAPLPHEPRLHPDAVIDFDQSKEAKDVSEDLRQLSLRAATAQPLHRNAQLETLESDFDRGHRIASLQRRVRHAQQAVNQDQDGQPVFLKPMQNKSRAVLPRVPIEHTFLAGRAGRSTHNSERPTKDVIPQRQRKRLAKRLDVDSRIYRQPSEELPEDTFDIPPRVEEQQEYCYQLRGLSPYGTRYPVDFDIKPLGIGSYFHQSTFIGSGEFADALHLAKRNLDLPTGAHMSIRIGNDNAVWSSWNEDVSDGMKQVSHAIKTMFEEFTLASVGSQADEITRLTEQHIHYLLRSVIRYLSRCLVFLDVADRQACVARILLLVGDLCEFLQDEKMYFSKLPGIRLHCFVYTLVLSKEATIIGNHPLVNSDTREHASNKVQETAELLANRLLLGHLGQLRTFYEGNRILSNRQGGIRDCQASISALVSLFHTVQGPEGQTAGFWSILNRTWPNNVDCLSDVRLIDHIWYNVLTVLPALEINKYGILQLGMRLNGSDGNWAFISQLMHRVFESYTDSSKMSGSTINEYIRSCLARCYNLVMCWGWYKCEPILYAAFDFFGRRGLGLLHKEESRGSPTFLDHLDQWPSFDIQQGESSFALFLKTLVASVQAMQKRSIYDDRKIASIVWRLIPNHGRTYPREAEVRQDDLDALRNHHDLLCCLYFAAPQSKRPPVSLLRNLVDHYTSHREACRINVRAWQRLSSFQASTREIGDCLQPFIDWYLDILRITIQQYRVARNEAETQFVIAKAQGVTNVTDALLESTVASNQRQIAATIVDALVALKRTLVASKGGVVASYLLRESAFWQSFDIFDPTQRRTHSIALEGLSIAKSVLNLQKKTAEQRESQNCSEESQDYGDTSALEDLVMNEQPHQASVADLVDILSEPIWRFMSNLFGADEDSEDEILLRAIDVWVAVAEIQVQRGKSTWTSYINTYSTTSWSQFRDTAQTRRYHPYFLARVTQRAKSSLSELRLYLVTSWLRSLVERESKLKFQHVLTSSLLEQRVDSVLLSNLPFVRSRNGAYEISLEEIRQRRLALLSSVFSNMRDSLDAVTQQNVDVACVRRYYTDVLRQLMLTMKANYQGLQTSGAERIACTTTQGAYVDFVQSVVTFLQQYTSDVCPVDRFFTDSTVFPLPATDPTYVVGRLRSYTTKLQDPKARKQLAVFVQTVSERAAVDQQQEYLVYQLQAAVGGGFENGYPQTPSLRYVLVTSIFPVYIELAISNECAWILAGPILQACGNILRAALLNVNIDSMQSVRMVVDLVLAILQAAVEPLYLAKTHISLLRLPHVLRIIKIIFRAAEEALPLIEYLFRAMQEWNNTWNVLLSEVICRFHMLGGCLQDCLSQNSGDELIEDDTSAATVQPVGFKDTLEFTRQQVKQSLDQEWFAQTEGRYFVRRGINSNKDDRSLNKEVFVDLREELVERECLLSTLHRFSLAYAAIFDLRCGGDHMQQDDGVLELMRDLVV